MKKTHVKTYLHQQYIDMFHLGPLCESKMIVKNEDNKLKKIGRNRLVFKQTSLPFIAPIKNKEAKQSQNQPECKGKENQPSKESSKYLSLVKNRHINIELRLERRAITQNIVDGRLEAQKIKEIILKRNNLMRNRKLLPLRNCMSAISVQIKQESTSLQPKQFRRNLLKKNSSQVQNQQQRYIPLHIRANKIAKQARAVSAPRLNPSNYKTCALQDFLNDWKDKNL